MRFWGEKRLRDKVWLFLRSSSKTGRSLVKGLMTLRGAWFENSLSFGFWIRFGECSSIQERLRINMRTIIKTKFIPSFSSFIEPKWLFFSIPCLEVIILLLINPLLFLDN